MDSAGNRDYSYIDLLKYRSVRVIALFMGGLSIGVHALYYGTEFSLDEISKDFGKNSFFVGIADAFGYGISDIFCPKFPRKKYLLASLVISSCFCFSFAIDPIPESCEG